MPAAIPPSCTSAEALGRYIPGRPARESAGPAWAGLHARLVRQEAELAMFPVPAVAEPSLVWVRSGSAVIEERSRRESWTGGPVAAGALFLTAPGSTYDLRLRRHQSPQLVTLQLAVGLPLLARAEAEVHGAAEAVRLRSVSAFADRFLDTAMATLAGELERGPDASVLLVQGLAQGIAVHLVRHYALEPAAPARRGGLAGHILRRLAEQMERDLAAPFSLARWAGLAGMSPSHFSRAFKQSTGVAPSQYLLRLRLAEARRLLRETDGSVIQIGLAVGYSSPSHFAQIFRRATGTTPMDYRRQG